MHDLAIRHDNGHGADIVAGAAVLNGLHAAGVGGHVAADRGELLAGLGGIGNTVGSGILGQVVHQNAGLNADHEVGQIIAEDLVHLGHVDDHAALGGNAAAAQTGTGAAGQEGDIIFIADLADGGDFLGRGDFHHNGGHVLLGDDGHLVVAVVFLDVSAGVNSAGNDFLKLFNYFRGGLIVSHDKFPP